MSETYIPSCASTPELAAAYAAFHRGEQARHTQLRTVVRMIALLARQACPDLAEVPLCTDDQGSYCLTLGNEPRLDDQEEGYEIDRLASWISWAAAEILEAPGWQVLDARRGYYAIDVAAALATRASTAPGVHPVTAEVLPGDGGLSFAQGVVGDVTFTVYQRLGGEGQPEAPVVVEVDTEDGAPVAIYLNEALLHENEAAA